MSNPINNIRFFNGRWRQYFLRFYHTAISAARARLNSYLNSKMDSENPLSLILVGQNELWDKLKLQSYAAVRQRIDIKCEIPQYDRAETARYIDCHLKYAGCTREIFTEKAFDEIYKYSAGAARAINKVCLHSLICAAQRKEKLVDDYLVMEVIDGELP